MPADRRVLETVLYAGDLEPRSSSTATCWACRSTAVRPDCSASFASARACCWCSTRQAARRNRDVPPHGAMGRVMPASPWPRASSTDGGARLRAHGVRDRARAGVAAWWSVVLCPRPGRQQHRVCDAAHLGPAGAVPSTRPPHDRWARRNATKACGGPSVPAAGSPPAVALRGRPGLPLVLHRLHPAAAGAGRYLGATLIWHPFLLNPHLPAGGVTRAQYLERKFGSVAQAHGVHRRVAQPGAGRASISRSAPSGRSPTPSRPMRWCWPLPGLAATSTLPRRCFAPSSSTGGRSGRGCPGRIAIESGARCRRYAGRW